MEQRSYRNHNFVFLKHQRLFGRRETHFVARAHSPSHGFNGVICYSHNF